MAKIGSSMMVFIGVFISALVGLMFVSEIAQLSFDASNNTTGIASTVYGFVPAFYALLMVGLMVGALYRIFKS